MSVGPDVARPVRTSMVARRASASAASAGGGTGDSDTADVTVRPVTAGDEPAVAALLAATGGAAWVGSARSSADEEPALQDDAEGTAGPRDVWLVAAVTRTRAEVTASPVGGDEAVVGLVGLRFSPDDVAEVLHVAVDRRMRQRGVGSALLAMVLDRAREEGAASLELEVRASNTAARGLYGDAGFEEVRTRAGYYRDGEDALVLAMPVPGTTAEDD